MKPASDGVPVTLAMFDAYGQGGVARTVLHLAGGLAERHPVRVVSVFRRRQRPRFPIDPRIDLDVLFEERLQGRKPHSRLHRGPTRMRPVPLEKQLNRATDVRLRKAMRGVGEGVLITTRPSLHLAAALWAPPTVSTIAWDHLNFPQRHRRPRQVKVLEASLPQLDTFAVLTEADAADYRSALARLGVREDQVAVVRNALPWEPSASPSGGRAGVQDTGDRTTTVVTAGRLVRRKGVDRVIRGFAPIARRRPDWHLDVWGQGPERGPLGVLVAKLGLTDQIHFRGYTEDLQTELEHASVYALGSRSEGFPMVLLEAMSAGLPLVAFDCPRGPEEIVVSGRNGFLVPDGDLEGFTRGLSTLIEDAELRGTLSHQARDDAQQYAPSTILAGWERLIERAAARPVRGA